MCLIIKKPEGVQISREFFENVSILNNDGWGVMYACKSGLKVYKGFVLDELINLCNSLKSQRIYIHMRKATVGDVDYKNIHPFQLTNGALLMHNGTIVHFDPKEGESDSVALTNLLNTLLEKYGEDILFDESFKFLLKGFIDSRMLILFPDGRELIITDYPWYFYEKEHLTVSNTYAWDLWKPKTVISQNIFTKIPNAFTAVKHLPVATAVASAKKPTNFQLKHLFTGNFYESN